MDMNVLTAKMCNNQHILFNIDVIQYYKTTVYYSDYFRVYHSLQPVNIAVRGVKKGEDGRTRRNNPLHTLHFTHAVSKNILDHTYIASVPVMFPLIKTWQFTHNTKKVFGGAL